MAINDKLKIIQYFGAAKLLGIKPPDYNRPITDFLPVVITESFEQDFEIPYFNISDDNVCTIYFLKHPKISYLLLVDKSEVFNVTQKYQQYAHNDNISKNKFKRLAKELKKAKKRLQKSNQEKATLIAMLSHEIGTPLTSIVGYSELLLKNDINTKKGLEIINRNAIYLQQLIENTLLFGSSEAGGLQLNIEQISIQKLFANLKTTLAPAASTKSLSLQMFHRGPQLINIDVARTKQILINLLNNAVKYTQEGSVELKFSIVKNNYVFSVIDTGLGVPEHLQKSIFNPWKRINENDEKGTGIGLFISQKLAKAVGGKLKLKYSDPAFGSIFQLLIPSQDTMTLKDINKKPEELDKNHGKTILIIDDDNDIIELIIALLQPSKLKVLSAHNFPEAQLLLQNNKIDIVLTDLHLGTVTATSFISKIKALDKNMPVLLMTAMPSNTIKLNYASLGFNDIVSKPINVNNLLSLVSKNL